MEMTPEKPCRMSFDILLTKYFAFDPMIKYMYYNYTYFFKALVILLRKNGFNQFRIYQHEVFLIKIVI